MSRDNCVKAIDRALSLQADTQDTAGIAREVEESIYEKNAGNDSSYKHEILSKVSNLKSNPDFANSLLDGTLNPATVADMTPEDMATPEKKAEIERIRQESIEENLGIDTYTKAHTAETELDAGIVRNTGQEGIEYDAP